MSLTSSTRRSVRRIFQDTDAVADLIGCVETFGGPPLAPERWQPWVLDRVPQLRHRERGVVVDLRDTRTPTRALRAVAEVAASPWSRDRDVAALLRALPDVLGTRLPTLEDDDAVALAVARAHARIGQPGLVIPCP